VTSLAIELNGIGKRYRLGKQERYLALRDVITRALKWPFSRSTADPDDILWALKDIDLKVNHGEVIGIVGRNGAGKSTLLKILSGVTSPSTGTGRIEGRMGTLLEVGTGFHPELTGLENIFLNGAILGMRRTEVRRKLDEIIAFAGVEKFLYTPVKHYSSGMYMRLAFSVAAHLEPEILLVDEVLAVGDLDFQKKCLGRMEDISQEGRTVLLVSHSVPSLQQLCNRGLLMHEGRLTMDGPISEVLDHYVQLGLEQVGEVNWPDPETAPGDSRLRVKAIRVVMDGQAVSVVDQEREFFVEIDYWNLVPGCRRVAGCNLINSRGVMVLSTANVPSACNSPDPLFGQPLAEGLYRAVCRVPGRLLNDSVYTVNVNLHEGVVGCNTVHVDNVLSFAVIERTQREDYKQEWGSAVRPPLDWRTELLDKDDVAAGATIDV
jgi:lipopolysaccharide transport system ATP-binding protein